MTKNILTLTALGVASIFISSCSSDRSFEDRLAKTLEKKPEILFNAISAHPEKFMNTVQTAVKSTQKNGAKNRAAEDEANILAAIEKPLQPLISKDQLIRGPKDAPITIVEYSDFECPYCSRSKSTMKALESKYPGKVRVIYKHLPLSFHPAAMISAKYYEAIRLQSPQKAFKFHDKIFSNQSSLKNGEPYLTRIAEELKIDMVKLQRDLHSSLVKNKIAQDMAEAKKFNFQGTPGFILNGVPIKGAFPVEHFESIISKLKEKGKLIL
jgi:protein-disulfide isomerase